VWLNCYYIKRSVFMKMAGCLGLSLWNTCSFERTCTEFWACFSVSITGQCL